MGYVLRIEIHRAYRVRNDDFVAQDNELPDDAEAIRGERASLVLLCGAASVLFLSSAVAAELTSQHVPFRRRPLPFCMRRSASFRSGLLPAFRAFSFFLPAIFGDPPFLRLR